ncbi:MAG: HAMP domain-containing histidine kinase [Acidimicrobiia bacterium]|nr:HAMP domain-containing histidine kinase [Acidimicrobiia bacterium]
MATAVTSVAAGIMIIFGLVSGETDLAWFATSPGTIALIGGVQVLRRRPDAPLLVVVSMALTVVWAPHVPEAMTEAVVLVLAVYGTAAMIAVPGRTSTVYAVASAIGAIGALQLAHAGSTLDSTMVLILGLGGGAVAAWATSKRIWSKQQRLERAFESPAVGVAIISIPDGKFLEANAAACEMLGYPDDELLEVGIADVTHPEDREESYERFKALVQGSDAYSQGALRYIRKNGEVSWALVTNTIIRDQRKRPLYALAQVVDIGEQKAAEKRLEQLVESKDRLVASVSHELRTPLTGLIGFAEVLRDADAGLSPAERVEMTESIAFEASEMAGIVEDLLTAARFDTGTLKVARVPVNLIAQSRQVAEAMEPHGLKVEVLGEPAHAMGDPARVRQIIRNLLTNAQRYGGEEITVSISADFGRARVAVTDNGSGVSPDDLDRIFEPYFTQDSTPGMASGFGLGLDICRKLAMHMEGDLQYSGEPGAARFELTLPPATQPASRPDDPGDARQIHQSTPTDPTGHQSLPQERSA